MTEAYINQYGLEQFIVHAEELTCCYGKRFNAPALLRKMLENSESF